MLSLFSGYLRVKIAPSVYTLLMQIEVPNPKRGPLMDERYPFLITSLVYTYPELRCFLPRSLVWMN